jgi:hypothetical protein
MEKEDSSGSSAGFTLGLSTAVSCPTRFPRTAGALAQRRTVP